MELMRTFISIELPEEIKKEIEEIDKKFEGHFIGKFTEKENLHLTLKFLGEIFEEQVEEVRRRLKQIRLKKFKVRLGKIGVFSEKFIRIVWIKLEGEGVFELQNEIDEKLKEIFDKEFRFMGHITIARVKRIKDRNKFLEFLKNFKIKEIEFQVKSFYLMSSELFPEGPKYGVIEEFVLS